MGLLREGYKAISKVVRQAFDSIIHSKCGHKLQGIIKCKVASTNS